MNSVTRRIRGDTKILDIGCRVFFPPPKLGESGEETEIPPNLSGWEGKIPQNIYFGVEIGGIWGGNLKPPKLESLGGNSPNQNPDRKPWDV